MAEQTIIPLQRISVFMPHRLNDTEMRLLFIARKPLFERLMQRIAQEKPNSIPQHHLIVGVRGMGKTMLLRRVAVELTHDPYFIGLSFPEEQYNIDRLSKFWLNALDALANALQKEGNDAAANRLDKEIEQLETIKIEAQKSTESYQLLIGRCQELGRRPVFLLDNLTLIFDRLSEVEHSTLRALITTANAPIFVAASPDLVKDDYQAPFYDAFDVEYLSKLDFRQMLSLIEHLAEITGQADFKGQLYQNLARLEALHQLTGGNVRTLILLFRLVVKDFGQSDTYQDLASLVDDMTPIYKAQFEEFSPQTQTVLDAIALLWDPCNLDSIREFTNLETGKIAAHLDRLQKAGWIQRLGGRKKSTYEISERFFNVWYLMRRGSRRQGRDLQWLTDFLQNWFNKKELRQILNTQLTQLNHLGENDLAYYLPMSRSLGKGKRAEAIKEQLYKRLIEIFDGDEQKVKDCMGVKPEELNDEWFEAHNIEKKQRLKLEAELKFDRACSFDVNGEWEKAEKLYRDILPNFTSPEIIWNNIGSVMYQMDRYQEAEDSCRKSISINPKYANPWYGLGAVLQSLGRYEEAKIACGTAMKMAPKDANIYDGLGNKLTLLGCYQEAENAFRTAIKIDKKNAYPWNGLGNLYQDHLAKYQEAKEAYLTAIELAPESAFPKANLVSLYRDKLNELPKALALFEESKTFYEAGRLQDAAFLHEATFALHDKNWGIAAAFWQQAFNQINEKLPVNTQDDWQRSAAVAVKLGYGQELLVLLEEYGHHRMFRPFYEAIKALVLNSEDYLRTQVAAEVREVALAMYAFMKKYND